RAMDSGRDFAGRFQHDHFPCLRAGDLHACAPWEAGMTDRARMIRVDQAGEYGATRIYAGQLAVMGPRGPHAGEIRAMADQERDHLAAFDALMSKRGVRPTALQPFWSVAGYALGAGTALLGPEAAMACTAAVEEEIDRHYSRQLEELEQDGDDAELAD